MEDEVTTTGDHSQDAADPTFVDSQQPEREQEQAPEMVPVTALQAERQQRQQMQEQMKMLQDHITLMQANKQEAPQQSSEFDSLSEDDVLTVGEAKKFMSQLQSQYQTGIEELKVQQKYRDYDQVVKDYLPEVIKANPALKTTLQNDPNRYELAYFLAKNSDAYREKNRKTKKSEDAQRIVENGKMPQSLSAVGGNAPKGQPNMYKAMTDKEFMELANKNRGYF